MPSASPRCFWPVSPGLLSLLAVTLSWSCVDGATYVELPLEPSQALLTFDPQTFAALQSGETPEIVRIRVAGTVFGGDKAVGFS